jgi:hypothetical protein
MKYLSTACFVVFSLGAAIAQTGPAAKARSPLEQSLIASEESFLAAVKKGDVAFLQNTLAPDFSEVGIDGQIEDRQDTLDELSDGGIDRKPYNFKVLAAGDGVEIVTYDAIVRVPAQEDEGPPPRYQHWSSVWVKQGDAWKLKFQQTTATHWGDW